MKKMQAEVTEEARKACEAFGLYDELAERMQKEMTEAYKEGRRSFFKKGESLKTRLGKKRYAETIRKIQESRNKTIKSERRRLVFGMEQRTKMKLHIGGFDERQRKKTSHRYLFKKHGYIVERGSSVIFYDEQTKRSPQMEANAPLYGLKIKAYGE